MSIAQKLKTVAENQQKVYAAGYARGQKAGNYGEGYEAGQQAEYDRFWDALQDNGNRTDYFAAFVFWDDETFKPKYDIIPSGTAMYMFAKSQITNLVTCIENAGIVFDTSKSPHVGYLFNDASSLVEAPIIDATSSSSVDRLFNGCVSLKKAGVIFPENKITAFANAFARCGNLEDFTAYGVIDIPLSFANSSKLTTASVQSIIDHLADLTGKTAQTLTLHATVGGKLTDAQKASITAKNWTLVY